MLCAGTVAAAVINFSMCRKEGSDPVSASDFVPDYKGARKPEKTEEEMIDDMLGVFGEVSKLKLGAPN